MSFSYPMFKKLILTEDEVILNKLCAKNIRYLKKIIKIYKVKNIRLVLLEYYISPDTAIRREYQYIIKAKHPLTNKYIDVISFEVSKNIDIKDLVNSYIDILDGENKIKVDITFLDFCKKQDDTINYGLLLKY